MVILYIKTIANISGWDLLHCMQIRWSQSKCSIQFISLLFGSDIVPNSTNPFNLFFYMSNNAANGMFECLRWRTYTSPHKTRNGGVPRINSNLTQFIWKSIPPRISISRVTLVQLELPVSRGQCRGINKSVEAEPPAGQTTGPFSLFITPKEVRRRRREEGVWPIRHKK